MLMCCCCLCVLGVLMSWTTPVPFLRPVQPPRIGGEARALGFVQLLSSMQAQRRRLDGGCMQ